MCGIDLRDMISNIGVGIMQRTTIGMYKGAAIGPFNGFLFQHQVLF